MRVFSSMQSSLLGSSREDFPHTAFVVSDRSEELGEFDVSVKEVLDKVGKFGFRTRCHSPDSTEGTLM